MAISRFISSVADKFQKGPFYSEESNLPSGGRSGYHPEAQQRVRRSRITGTQAQRTAAQSPVFRGSGSAQFGQPGYTGYSVGYQAATTFPQNPVTAGQSAVYQQPVAPQQSVGYRQPAAPQQNAGYQQQAMPLQNAGYQRQTQQGVGYRQQTEAAVQSAAFQQPMAVGQSFPLPQPGAVMSRTPGYQAPAAAYRGQPAGTSVQIPGMQRPVTFQAANSQNPMIYQRAGFAAGAPSASQPTQPTQPQEPQNQPEVGYSGGMSARKQQTQRSVVIPVTPSGYQGNEQPNRGRAVKNRYAAPAAASDRYRRETAGDGYKPNFAPKPDQPYQSKFQLGGDTGFGVKQREEARSRRFGGNQAQDPQPQAAPQPVQPAAPAFQPAQAMQPVQPVQPMQPMQPVQPDNLSYMPNVFVGSDGTAYRHVERLTQPMSASTCYRLIEFMRNGESVIVNTELIQDERENQRCLDLLYGAAYTMNCTFTRISARSIYLIAPATVTVIAYESIRQMNEQDAAVRWPGAESAILSGKRPKRAPVFGNYRAVE